MRLIVRWTPISRISWPGGAAIPPLVGAVSGSYGYVTALIVPAACYVLLCLFAVAAARAPVSADHLAPAATIH